MRRARCLGGFPAADRGSAIRGLVLLVASYMGQRDYDRFGVEILQAAGLDVEVWECVGPIQGDSPSGPPLPFFPGIVRFSSVKELMCALDRLGSDRAILSILGTSFGARRIHALLTKARKEFGIYRSGFAQFADTRSSSSAFLKRFISKLAAPRALFESLAARTWGRYLLVQPSYEFLCGGSTAARLDKGEQAGDLVWAHQLDYDLYLKVGKSDTGTNGRHIVYLDDFLPFHPDWRLTGRSAPMTAEEHYPQLVRFFQHLESELGLPVVVAAHPRSIYEKHPDYFGGRQVMRGKTIELVRDSACVVLSASTALNFAVIYGKPMIFVCTDAMRRYYPFFTLVENLSRIFGKTPVNLDNEMSVGLASGLAVDAEAYRQYRSAYIKCPGTPELNSWQILARYLMEEMSAVGQAH